MGKSLIIKGISLNKENSIMSETIGNLSNNTSKAAVSQSAAFYTSRSIKLSRITISISKESTSDFAIYKEKKLYKTIESGLEIKGDTNNLYTINFPNLIEIPANCTFGFTNVCCNYKVIKSPDTSDGYSSGFNKDGVRNDFNWGMEATIYTY